MKTFTRWLLALLLVATPMLALVELAFANTELVPASRLVAPYWDISAPRKTLFMLTNVSRSVDLLTVPASFTQPARGVHVEFYDKTCVRQDVTIDLSAGDLDQFDVSLLGTALPNNQGWADLDVRRDDAQRDKDSIQCNVLLGNVVVSDSVGDFAVAYPMASDIGSSTKHTPGIPCSSTVVGDTIVTHDLNGTALAGGWSGRYEPFPARVFVPFFFAEGGPLGFTTQLVVAGPANGNYAGGATGESPGQNLPGLDFPATQAGWLLRGTALFWDACENKESRSFGSHWINAKLSDVALLGFKANQNLFAWTHPGLACKNQANFPSVDDDTGSHAVIGWVDLPNSTTGLPSVFGPTIPNVNDSDGEHFRGMVGILIQNTTSGGKKEGDVVRLWGDPAYDSRNGNYSLVDDVSHTDLD